MVRADQELFGLIYSLRRNCNPFVAFEHTLLGLQLDFDLRRLLGNEHLLVLVRLKPPLLDNQVWLRLVGEPFVSWSFFGFVFAANALALFGAFNI